MADIQGLNSGQSAIYGSRVSIVTTFCLITKSYNSLAMIIPLSDHTGQQSEAKRTTEISFEFVEKQTGYANSQPGFVE